MIQNGTIRQIPFEFLLALHLACYISKAKRDIG